MHWMRTLLATQCEKQCYAKRSSSEGEKHFGLLFASFLLLVALKIPNNSNRLSNWTFRFSERFRSVLSPFFCHLHGTRGVERKKEKKSKIAIDACLRIVFLMHMWAWTMATNNVVNNNANVWIRAAHMNGQKSRSTSGSEMEREKRTRRENKSRYRCAHST